jgi:hypothetical protein
MRRPNEDIHGNYRSVERSQCPRQSPEAPSDGICLECGDAKIFPENRQKKFLIRRRSALRGRRNHPGQEIRRRKQAWLKHKFDAPRAVPKRTSMKSRMSTKPKNLKNGLTGPSPYPYRFGMGEKPLGLGQMLNDIAYTFQALASDELDLGPGAKMQHVKPRVHSGIAGGR